MENLSCKKNNKMAHGMSDTCLNVYSHVYCVKCLKMGYIVSYINIFDIFIKCLSFIAFI